MTAYSKFFSCLNYYSLYRKEAVSEKAKTPYQIATHIQGQI